MYLVFRSSDPTTTGKKIQGVELAVSKPSYIHAASATDTKPDAYRDLCYLDLSLAFSTDAARADYITKVFNNVGEISIKTQPVGLITEIPAANYKNYIVFSNAGSEATDRKLDPAEWHSEVRPAWYRAAHQTDLFNV